MRFIPKRLVRATRTVAAFYVLAIVLIFILSMISLTLGLDQEATFFVALAGWPLSGLALWAHRRYRAARVASKCEKA